MLDPNVLGSTLVTGGSGFVGQVLVQRLVEAGLRPRILSRRSMPQGLPVESVVGDLTQQSTLRGIAEGIHTIFHLAGHAHAEDEGSASSDLKHSEVTVQGTAGIVREAERAGVRRLVFASSVKAMGEETHGCVDESHPPRPQTAYGRAKLEAERLVLEDSNLKHRCVLRFPLIYGPNARGNLALMLRAAARGYLPPLPMLPHRRSMIDVRDAVGALVLAVADPRAHGKVFLVTDGDPHTARELYEQMCHATGRKPAAWEVPNLLLELAALGGDLVRELTGRRAPIDRARLRKLLGEALYSSKAIEDSLQFRPEHQLAESLCEMAAQSPLGAAR